MTFSRHRKFRKALVPDRDLNLRFWLIFGCLREGVRLARPAANGQSFKNIMVNLTRAITVCAIVDQLATGAGRPKLFAIVLLEVGHFNGEKEKWKNAM
jgi:hypothetical protein